MKTINLPEDAAQITMIQHGDQVIFRGEQFTFKLFGPPAPTPHHADLLCYFSRYEPALENVPLTCDGITYDAVFDPSIYLRFFDQSSIAMDRTDEYALYSIERWINKFLTDPESIKVGK